MSVSERKKFVTQQARFGVRLNYIIFPIDFRELHRALAKNGYEISPIAGEVPGPPTRIAFSGEIARKEETTVIANADSGRIGVVGRSLNDVTESFKELVNVIKAELDVSLHENVRFYWCIIHCKIETGKIPGEEIAKTENKDYFAQFNKILGEDLSAFSVRLSSRGRNPNQEDWLDIAIEPDVANDKRYHVGVVFRNPERDKTEKFVKDLENKLLKLIEVIEAR